MKIKAFIYYDKDRGYNRIHETTNDYISNVEISIEKLKEIEEIEDKFWKSQLFLYNLRIEKEKEFNDWNDYTKQLLLKLEEVNMPENEKLIDNLIFGTRNDKLIWTYDYTIILRDVSIKLNTESDNRNNCSMALTLSKTGYPYEKIYNEEKLKALKNIIDNKRHTLAKDVNEFLDEQLDDIR